MLLEAAEQASGRKRAWDGLREFMQTATQMHMRDRGLFEAIAERLMADRRMVEMKGRLLESIGALVERAKREGDLRKDVAAQDVPVLVCAAAQAGTTAGRADPELWRRYLQILLDGLRADGLRARLKPVPPAAAR